MKKIVCTIMAVAALAACTKSEVNYDAPAEIEFAPATKNITKAAMTGPMETTKNLGIWAYWNGTDGSTPEANATYANYTDSYLVNAEFANKSGVNWGGKNQAYYWPTNGALVFAGYNKPAEASINAAYSGLTDNKITFSNYSQSTDMTQTFDLCWFGRTAASYNYRLSSGTAVPVTLSHALTWITINVKGDDVTAPSGEGAMPWKITKATIKGANTLGVTGECVFDTDGKANATWTSSTPDDIIVKSASQNLTTTAMPYESTTAGLVVIPQTPVKLEVEYEYPVAGTYKAGKSTVDLTLTNHKDESGNEITSKIATWLSGTHYTYTLVFKANEILVAPSYGDWVPVDQTVTVE